MYTKEVVLLKHIELRITLMTVRTDRKKDEAFGLLLKRYISARQLTQAEFAKLAATSQPTVSAIYHGNYQCGLKLARRFADVLKLEGKDRLQFLLAAKKPKWKGFDHAVDGPEAIFAEAVLSRLSTVPEGKGAGISSVTHLKSPTGNSHDADLLVVLNNGAVITLRITATVLIHKTKASDPVAEAAELIR